MLGKVQIYPKYTSKKLSGRSGGVKTERESKAKLSIGPNKISLNWTNIGPLNFYCVIWDGKVTYWPHTEQW